MLPLESVTAIAEPSGVGQKAHRPAGISTTEALVDSESAEQVGGDIWRVCSVQFLQRIQPIVKKMRGRPADGLAHPAPEGVIDERPGCAPSDRSQMIARVPRVCVSSVGEQIAVRIVAHAGPVEFALRVVGIVGRASPPRLGQNINPGL